MEGLQRIDALLRREHHYLNAIDECYFLLHYLSGVGFSHNCNNRFIGNYKLPVGQRGRVGGKIKMAALQVTKQMLCAYLPEIFDLEDITLVPIPPSKTKTNPSYDDRNRRVLIWLQQMGLDVRELLSCKNDLQAAHTISQRPSIAMLKQNLSIQEEACCGIRRKIVLFDDVITSGAHFVACKECLQEVLPVADIAGIFIARRTFLLENVMLAA